MKFNLFDFEINFTDNVFFICIASIRNINNEGRALFYFGYIEDHFETDLLYFYTNRG